jgi:hypothetical protein
MASQCRHADIRTFDGARCCMSCGLAIIPEADSEEAEDSNITNNSPSPYSYTQLRYELGQETRLVEISPAIVNDGFKCKIIHVNLADNPQFEALSYTWADQKGNTGLTERIYCQKNAYVSVSSNCVSSLKRLRYKYEPRRCGSTW